MADQSNFDLSVSQNEYLSEGDEQLDAVLKVTARGLTGEAGGSAPEAAEVIAIDCSGSMDYPRTKIAAARRATAAAIDALREGAHFAVIAGTDRADMVYPTDTTLAISDPDTRQAAKAAVRRLAADGGTAIGTWLELAGRLLDAQPTAVRHVIMLTDGKNEFETREQLNEVLRACSGKFVCDARGIGTDWEPRELLHIASLLHGSADAVRDPEDLVADFTNLMRAAMGKVVPDLGLEIRTMWFTRLRFVKQVYPTENDLTDLGEPVDGQTTRFSTGSWGDGEERHYHVCLDVDPHALELHKEVQTARVSLVTDGAGGRAEQGEPMAIRAYLTDDPKLSTWIHPDLDHYALQAELGQAMRAGCDAYDAGDLRRAEAEWGRAVRLAAEVNNTVALTRLTRVVDIVGEPADGVVRVKPELSRIDRLPLGTGSVISERSPHAPGQPGSEPPPGGPDRECPRCQRICRPNAKRCARCGHRFEAAQ